MPPRPKTPPKAKPDKPERGKGRKIKYPALIVELRAGQQGLTAENMKELMGWTEETETEKFGEDYLFKDKLGNKIRLSHNTANRPFYIDLADKYAQALLTKHWSGPNGNGKTVNGESMIFGKTGEIISAQHRGVGVVFAEQRRNSNESEHWKEHWKGPIKLDTVLVLGVDESDEVVNTVETGKSRTPADMLYRSVYFSNVKTQKDRLTQAKAAAHAIRFLWHRTGAKDDAFVPLLTHDELMDFLARHEKLVLAIRHVCEEDGDKNISSRVPLGYAAAMLYLQGSSDTDLDDIGYLTDRREKKLDWKQWDKAQEFWTLLSQVSVHDFDDVRYALNKLTDHSVHLGGNRLEKTGIIVKAWQEFKADRIPSKASLALEYAHATDGSKTLISKPDFGGIDIGEPKVKTKPETTVDDPAEVEKAVEEMKAEKNGHMKDPVTPQTPAENFFAKKAGFEKHLGFFKSVGTYITWGTDAERAAKLLGKKFGLHPDGNKRLGIPHKDWEETVKALHKAKVKIVVIEVKDGETIRTEV